MNLKRPTRLIIIKMSKVKDKERIIKTARENSYVQGNTHKTMSRYFSTKFAGQKGIAQYIQNAERKNLPTLPEKAILLN